MHVYIVDDDEAVGRTIGRSVSREGWQFILYTCAETFLEQVEDLSFGCVVLDLKMPRMGGLELLSILETKCPEWPVIMMSGHGSLAEAVQSFRSGAIHFLTKPFDRQVLFSVLNEATQIANRRQAQAEAQREAHLIKRLSPRETEVLQGISEGHASKTIAWKLGISTRTVEMHRSNILSKLGARNASQAAAIAHRWALTPRHPGVMAGPL